MTGRWLPGGLLLCSWACSAPAQDVTASIEGGPPSRTIALLEPGATLTAVIDVPNPSTEAADLVLDLEWPLADRVRVQAGDQTWEVGERTPLADRPFAVPEPAVPLRVPPGATVPVRVEVSDSSAAFLRPTLHTRAGYARMNLNRRLAQGLFYGFAALTAVLSLMLRAVSGARGYESLAFYATVIAGWAVGWDGTWLAWGASPYLSQQLIGVFGQLAPASGAWITRSMLDTRTHAPRLDKALAAVLYVHLATVPLVLLLGFERFEPAALPLALLAASTIFAATVKVLWTRPREALYYAVGSLLLVTTALAYLLRWVGLDLPGAEHGFRAGNMLMFLCLGLAMADRLARVSAEREAALKDRLAAAERTAALSRTFERYVPREFLALLERDDIVDIDRGDQVQRQMTVMFSDLRGFTTLAERLAPAEMARQINDYLGQAEGPIVEGGGFIHGYIGDAIVALFPESPDGAVAAAVGHVEALRALNEARADRGEDPLRAGIGIHSGRVILGVIGGKYRIEPGVVGDPVNTSARIESLTKLYGAAVLISGETRDRLTGDWKLRRVDALIVKGKTQPIALWEVLDPLTEAERAARTDPRYEAAWSAYARGELTEARDLFDALEDDPASQVLARRCDLILEEGLPTGWDGTWTMRTK